MTEPSRSHAGIRPARIRVPELGRHLLLVLLAQPVMGCAHPSAPVKLVAHPDVHVVQSGSVYALVYDSEVDSAPVGTRWTGDFTGSPMAVVSRRPFIIKADDFGGPISPAGASFLELADSSTMPVSLGIITHLLEEGSDEISTYQALDRAGFELWFHGHTHRWRPPAEFFLDLRAASFSHRIDFADQDVPAPAAVDELDAGAVGGWTVAGWLAPGTQAP